MTKYDTPLLKWIGGKTQIINSIINQFPNQIENYHELFIGGASVLLALLNQVEDNIIKITNNIYAYDNNEQLINFYINIQKNPKEFYDEVNKIINTDNWNTKEFYYEKRTEYNNLTENNIYKSSLFLYLNKLCFRGLYRASKNNKFNVPYGNYKNPNLINKEHLFKISKLIQNVIFIHNDFEQSAKNISDDDFVYFDPPYYPETKTANFVAYTAEGFNLDKHNKLFKLCNDLNKKNIKFMMSNSDTELVRNNFIDNNYIIEEIECKRRINPKKPGSKVIELLIKNF
jgi:DNA adenine methylase